MKKSMQNNKGLYSIIQYSDHPERLEYVNIGVAIFHDDFSKVVYKFSETPREVNRVFRTSLGQHFEFLIESVRARLSNEILKLKSTEDLRRFISTRAGKIRFSELKPVVLENVEFSLTYLFDNLVTNDKPVERPKTAKRTLSEKFKNKGIDQLLSKNPEPYKLSAGPTIKADFGYQNGSYNYIQAISLNGNVDNAVKKFGGLSLEGKWLFNETSGPSQKKLNIVADTSGQSNNFIYEIKRVIDTNEVKLFFMDDIAPLIDDIRHSLN